jgi:hypothetical protein
MNTRFAVLSCALVAASLQTAAAQQPRQHPADPAAEVPPVRHSSAFAGYRALGDEKTASWREVNDDVARAGGHIGILRGQPAAQSTGHAGHAGHPPGAAK